MCSVFFRLCSCVSLFCNVLNKLLRCHTCTDCVAHLHRLRSLSRVKLCAEAEAFRVEETRVYCTVLQFLVLCVVFFVSCFLLLFILSFLPSRLNLLHHWLELLGALHVRVHAAHNRRLCILVLGYFYRVHEISETLFV